MYRIGICDDELNVCAELEIMVQEIMQESNISFEIEPWYSGESLCQNLDKGGMFDLLFLDIELITTNGIDVGRFIRNNLNDLKMHIVYISYNRDYAMQLFKMWPLDFLVKPLTHDAVEGVIGAFLRFVEKKKMFLEYQIGNSHCKQPYEDIVYLKSDDKKIQVVMCQEQKEFYGKLKVILPKITPFFLQIHQSFAINQDYVAEYTYEQVTMLNGDKLNISRPYRNIVREKLIRNKRERENEQ